MKQVRLGLTVAISLLAVIILILIQTYVIREYYLLKSKDFDVSYSTIITKSLDEIDDPFAENPFDAVYNQFNQTAYYYISLADFDSTSLQKREFQKQIRDSFQKVLAEYEPNTVTIKNLLKLNNLDTIFSSKYILNEISLLDFTQKINIYANSNPDMKASRDMYIKSYQVEGDYFLVKFDYYVDFTQKARTIYSEMKGLLIAIVCTIVAVLLAFAYTLRILNKQKKLSELKSDFIDQITHEFKTPLSSIAVAVSSLKLPAVQESSSKIDELAENIRKQYLFLTRMIDHVLETSLLERKKMQITKKNVPIVGYMKEIINSFRTENMNKNIQINEYYDVGDDFTYNLDPLHFSRVITNLLSNSVKYTHSPAIIDIRVTKAETLSFSFSDNGIGIAKEHLKNVFMKFYRVENSLPHKVKGLGLGLYIARQIVESHEGGMEIKSELNKGTTVVIKLPLNTNKPG